MKLFRRLLLVSVFALVLALAACDFDIDLGNGNTDPDPADYNAEYLQEVIDTVIDTHYEDLDEEALYEAAIYGIFDGIDGDPYSRYMSEEERRQFDEGLGEEFVGVGITVQNVDERVVIIEVFPDSPAEAAGLIPGDVVTHVDGVDKEHKTYFETVDAILGEVGTEVELGVDRPNVEDTLYFTMSRERIDNPTVTHEVFEIDDEVIGYLEINAFGPETAGLTEEALDDLEASGIDSLIVDVRDNSGGYLDAARDVIDLFIPASDQPMFTIEQQIGGETISMDYDATGDEARPYEIVTLMNSQSASAAEIFAVAMKENAGYDVYGTPSFGKGTMQSLASLSSESQLSVTSGRWLTPEGRWIDNIQGDDPYVTPTVEVEQSDHFFAYNVYIDEPLVYDTVSEAVANVQNILSALGYEMRTDGYYDEETVSAVEAFQAEEGLEATGEVDEETAAALSDALLEYRRDIENDKQFQAAKEYLLE